MTRKYTPTPEQKEKAEAKRAALRALAQKINAMSEAERAEFAQRINAVTIEGRLLSAHNQIMLAAQREAVTMIGGYNQWRAAGRHVRKGETALCIWAPTSPGKEESTAQAAEAHANDRPGFVLVSVFDVSQTDLTEAAQ